MRAASQWLRRQRSVFRRGILVVVLSILGGAVADDASAASKAGIWRSYARLAQDIGGSRGFRGADG